eukprot:TRINITY_DN4850_c0_g1_i1.p1 TRINITY_DN4850_c0_g1~~TRINITY_DN4850_c0_g1_i1.p1  ORF type:complete len:790 (+),score=169.57 TRINITY_DN4850_c0_g1_i1:57-2426(+)
MLHDTKKRITHFSGVRSKLRYEMKASSDIASTTVESPTPATSVFSSPELNKPTFQSTTQQIPNNRDKLSSQQKEVLKKRGTLPKDFFHKLTGHKEKRQNNNTLDIQTQRDGPTSKDYPNTSSSAFSSASSHSTNSNLNGPSTSNKLKLRPFSQGRSDLLKDKKKCSSVEEMIHKREMKVKVSLDHAQTHSVDEKRLHFESLSPEDKLLYRRNEAINELLETEYSYVDDLTCVVEVYLNGMKESNLVQKQHISAIFSNIEMILNINKEFASEFKKASLLPPPQQNFGEIFLKLAFFLRMYTQYTVNQERSLQTIRELKTQPEFSRFLEECQRNPQCRGSTLTAFLIKPVQRICKYPLLLREIQNYLSAEHSDYNNLTKAIETVETIVTEVNNSKTKIESILKIMDIQNSLEGAEHLLQPGRRFVKEGPLLIVHKHRLKEVFVFLFNDLLLSAKSQKKKLPFRLSSSANLLGASILGEHTDDPSKLGFTVHSPPSEEQTTAVQLRFVARSTEECKSWQTSIHSCILHMDSRHKLLSIVPPTPTPGPLSPTPGGSETLNSPTSPRLLRLRSFQKRKLTSFILQPSSNGSSSWSVDHRGHEKTSNSGNVLTKSEPVKLAFKERVCKSDVEQRTVAFEDDGLGNSESSESSGSYWRSNDSSSSVSRIGENTSNDDLKGANSLLSSDHDPHDNVHSNLEGVFSVQFVSPLDQATDDKHSIFKSMSLLSSHSSTGSLPIAPPKLHQNLKIPSSSKKSRGGGSGVGPQKPPRPLSIFVNEIRSNTISVHNRAPPAAS